VQSLPVDGPDPEMFGLQTPESIVDRSVRVRRKLPTPPVTDPREVEEHVRQTLDKLRTQRAFRQHLGGAKNSDSDSVISTIGLQNHVRNNGSRREWSQEDGCELSGLGTPDDGQRVYIKPYEVPCLRPLYRL
jgi:hypothetical protein